MPVINITGAKGTRKSTLADFIKNKLRERSTKIAMESSHLEIAELDIVQIFESPITLEAQNEITASYNSRRLVAIVIHNEGDQQ